MFKKTLKWILCVLVFIVCIYCSLYLGTALIDGIVAGVVFGGLIELFFRTLNSLKNNE